MRESSSDRFGWIHSTVGGLFSVFFPSDCRLCGFPLLNISRLPVCLECLSGIKAIQGNVCSICGERVLSSYIECDDDGLRRCPICRRIERPFYRVLSYGSYEGGLRELIHLLKYNGVRPVADVLGHMLAESLNSLENLWEQPLVLVIPVPLYKAKQRQRGFNQAYLIARAAMKRMPARRLELAADVLKRLRDTHSQIGLTSHQRRENLRGAFAVANVQQVTGREVILVDDVYTTGATASECARVLRRGGARKVWVATVARTLKMASKYQETQGFKAAEWQDSKDRGDSETEPQLETMKL